jgi:phosphate starvation-inducible PhoH-like protein
MFGLLGPNGAGKSTFMSIVAGLVEPTAGDVWLDGTNIVEKPQFVRERLGFLPGDLMAKIDPYLRPLYDALYDMMDPEAAVKLIERQTIFSIYFFL